MSQGSPIHDALISHRRHKIIKIILRNSRIQRLKLFYFSSSNLDEIILFQDHFERVKEWMKMRYSGKSILFCIEKIDMSQLNREKSEKNKERSEKIIYLKATSEYFSDPTLYQFYELQGMDQVKILEQKIIEFYMYYIEELFQVIVRAGSIPNFFYTPKNIFISRPPLMNSMEVGKLTANYLSTVGLSLIYLKEPILLEDLEEIFPLLPTNLQALIRKGDFERQFNRIIKMRALAWNILCLIIKEVPNMLIREQDLGGEVRIETVYALLAQQKGIMEELLVIHNEYITAAELLTGIHFKELFQRILVDNCHKFTWTEIYKQLFLNSQKNNQKKQNENQIMSSTQESSKARQTLSEKLINSTWKRERKEIKKFYENRCIEGGSIVYFLIRVNINFRKMMRHLNVLEFIGQTNFSADSLRVHLSLIQSCIQNLEIEREDLIPYSMSKISERLATSAVEREMVRITSPQMMGQGFNRSAQIPGQAQPILINHTFSSILNQLHYNMVQP